MKCRCGKTATVFPEDNAPVCGDCHCLLPAIGPDDDLMARYRARIIQQAEQAEYEERLAREGGHNPQWNWGKRHD